MFLVVKFVINPLIINYIKYIIVIIILVINVIKYLNHLPINVNHVNKI